jgi:multisubunit Na+/H+ antiporter MnhG subunit
MVVVPPLAHIGHLLIDVPLFIGPILLLVAALAIHSAYARRHGATRPDQGTHR